MSSDYERAEWKESIREQQKKCEWAGPDGPFSTWSTITIVMWSCDPCMCVPAGPRTTSLTSVELQLLTSSCMKLQTVQRALNPGQEGRWRSSTPTFSLISSRPPT